MSKALEPLPVEETLPDSPAEDPLIEPDDPPDLDDPILPPRGPSNEKTPLEPIDPPTTDIPAGPAEPWKEESLVEEPPPAPEPPAEKPAPPPPIGTEEPPTPAVDDTAVEPSWPPPDPWGGAKPPKPDISSERNPNQTIPFLVHDASGRILRTGYCSLRDLRTQAQVGEVVLEAEANDHLQKVVNGRIRDKTPEEITQRQEPPPEKQRAFISQEDWELFQSRFHALDERLKKMEQREPGITGQL